MSALSKLVEVRHRSVRAVNLDEDLGDVRVLDGYAPGAHVIDALRRIAIGFQDGPRTRAWSITGPYGSGKSSFAHLLCSLAGPKNAATQRRATKILREADPQLAATIARERRRLDVEPRGLILAAVSSQREPIVDALLRALLHGAEAYWSGPGRKPDVLHELRNAATETGTSANTVLSLFEALACIAPVLVIVDELGKNLEYAADRAAAGDLHLLQRLAEQLSSSERFTGGLLTLAHLAFEDYLLGAGEQRRREWRKVHGRFDDIPFVANSDHAIRLLGEALDVKGSAKHRKVIERRCIAAEAGVRAAATELPLPSEAAGGPCATYPLHPAVALALPVLAAELAQHDRSLVSFLTSDAPNALPRFLADRHLGDHTVPFFRAADLYDYFFEDGAATVLNGPEGQLAREIHARVVDAGDLEPFELRVLKTVALFNLISGPRRPRAADSLIEEAVVGPEGTPEQRQGVRETLVRLGERSITTYREFAGEHRVWQGSDFDAHGHILAAREHLASSADPADQLLEIVAKAHPLRPEVARRHSQQKHVLRYFECRYAAGVPDADVQIRAEDADGLILYVLAHRKPPTRLRGETAGGEPLIVVWSSHGEEVSEVGLDFAAANAVLSGASELGKDPVARREMRHRVSALQAALADRVDDAFRPERSGVALFVGGKRRRLPPRAEFSQLLSELCDRRYPTTPVVRNEMVNRRELTSQGAKARRVLLERAFTNESEPRLAIEGYGPERAMYEAVYFATGLHRQRDDGAWSFGPPPSESPLSGVWNHLNARLDGATRRPIGADVLYEELAAPPFGMKSGAIPLLLVAALQYRADDVFLYQEGTFQPVIEPAHIERLLKSPERFALKRASMIGLRAKVFAELRSTLSEDVRPSGQRLRNSTTLAVVRPLVAFASSLPESTRQTKRTSEIAQSVCATLLSAREPDELLFSALPQACGLSEFPDEDAQADHRLAGEYVSRLRAALGELATAYERLLSDIGDLLHGGFAGEVPRPALRDDLRSRSHRVRSHVIEPRMRAFLATATDENLDDRDWLEAMAMTIAGKPPTSWSDHDLTMFEALVAERSRWFRRLELLWHETQPLGGDGFVARRVTITAPDGREHAQLVAADAATEKIVEDVLGDALAKLEQRIGSRAQDALLGALADRVLSHDASTTGDVQERKRKASGS